jgi:hypothetical protein
VVLADAFPVSDNPEAAGFVEYEAGGVLGEDAGLDRPDARCLGGGDQLLEQGASDALAVSGGCDVDGMFDDSGVDTAAADRACCYPADDLSVVVDCQIPGRAGG